MRSMIQDLCIENLRVSKVADDAYKTRNFPLAHSCLNALEITDLRTTIYHINRRGWTFYHEGLSDESKKAICHEEARIMTNQVMEKSEGREDYVIDIWITTLKLQMLLASSIQETTKLFRKGKKLLKGLHIPQIDKKDYEAQVLNSLGIPQRRSNPKRAILIFRRAAKLAKYGSVDLANAPNNESDCWKNLLVSGTDIQTTLNCYEESLKCLNEALRNYQANETGHIKSVQKKIIQLEEAKTEKLKQLEEK